MNELVLIVEDEEHIAQLLRYNLQKAGYRTVEVSDGGKALRAIRIDWPDLVLLDLMLPGMDGWEVCRILRSNGQGASTPIIMLTALAGEEARIRGLQAGADDFITKPFSVREVLIKIRKLLDKSAELKSHQRKSTESETQLSYLVHELKNSVSVISGYASLADDRGDARRYLGRITMTTKHMEQILDDASLLVRLESGDRPWPLEPVPLLDVVEDSLESLRKEADARGVGLHVSGGAGCRIMGERRAVQQIVTNLVANAIKYNRSGGTARVRIEEQRDEISLSVIDDGPGIAPDQRHRIFEKYYRCPGSERVKGSGLGLYVVKLFTKSIGGSVRVTENTKSGSIFTITFRKKDATAPALPSASP